MTIILAMIILTIQILTIREQLKIEKMCLKNLERKLEEKQEEKIKTAQLDLPEWAEKIIDEYMANAD